MTQTIYSTIAEETIEDFAEQLEQRFYTEVLKISSYGAVGKASHFAFKLHLKYRHNEYSRFVELPNLQTDLLKFAKRAPIFIENRQVRNWNYALVACSPNPEKHKLYSGCYV